MITLPVYVMVNSTLFSLKKIGQNPLSFSSEDFGELSVGDNYHVLLYVFVPYAFSRASFKEFSTFYFSSVSPTLTIKSNG